MRRFQAVPYEDQTEINMSPMLDVVFIMLIFFVVLATFLDETAMPVFLPNAASEVDPDSMPISVVVKPDSVFVINGRVTSAAGVQSYVQALHAENPGATYGVLLAEGSKVKDAAVAIEAGRRIGLDVIPLARSD